MRIYEASPFNNESIIAAIKIREGEKWVDELHITESNKTFSYLDKPYIYQSGSDIVRYHKIDGKKLFNKPKWVLTKRYPWFVWRDTNRWGNERVQRNCACEKINPNDDDIVVLSDVDEVLDPCIIYDLIDCVRSHGIITVKLYFTLYYFNLFSANWSGPPDYSYRVFLMDGKYFKTMKVTSDDLRKMGEGGKLMNDIFCFPKIAGFHHSWLGDGEIILKKMMSYSHSKEDHDSGIFSKEGKPDINEIKKRVMEGKSIFGDGHKLIVRDDIELLESVRNLRPSYSNLFL